MGTPHIKLDLSLRQSAKTLHSLQLESFGTSTKKSTTGLETKMLKLTLVMATILLHVAASQPVDVNVEDMTVNGVKIPIGLYQPGKLIPLSYRDIVVHITQAYFFNIFKTQPQK